MSDNNGFDMRGPGASPGGRGLSCRCRWSSRLHGDRCPEHGRQGVPIPDVVARLQAQAERLFRLNSEALAVGRRALAIVDEMGAEIARLVAENDQLRAALRDLGGKTE